MKKEYLMLGAAALVIYGVYLLMNKTEKKDEVISPPFRDIRAESGLNLENTQTNI